MSSVKRAHGKLLRSGFVPSIQSEDYECWMDARSRGCEISFYKNGDNTDTFKVQGRSEDRAEFDEFNSYYTVNLSEAIRISRT